MQQDVTQYDIGTRVKLLRVAQGLNQEELAEQIQVSPQSIGAYERNERIPRDPVKHRLATFFNTDVQTLFYENVHMSK